MDRKACKHKERKEVTTSEFASLGLRVLSHLQIKKAHHVGASAKTESELPLMESPEDDSLNYVTIDVVRDDIGPPILLDLTLNSTVQA